VIHLGDDSSVSMGLVCGAGSISASMAVGGGTRGLEGVAATKVSTGPSPSPSPPDWGDVVDVGTWARGRCSAKV
jgi:hypothetical protein